jgi:hypothetical protein
MDEDNYARYTSIVQSSGMGKSRTVDELSKTHLVVPMNLRQESKGKPFDFWISSTVMDQGNPKT